MWMPPYHFFGNTGRHIIKCKETFFFRNDRMEHDLQKQITDITRALGIKAARQIRNGKGQFTSEKVEEPTYEG